MKHIMSPPKKKFDLASVKEFIGNVGRKVASNPKLSLAFVFLLAVLLAVSLILAFKLGQESSETKGSQVEEDKRILATGFDCRQKQLCDANAVCTTDHLNTDRNVCVCNNGFQGNGPLCHDIDECLSEELHSCPSNAKCVNAIGTYKCTCVPGYEGDGRSCTDINECSISKHNCSTDSLCNNTIGSYTCTCLNRFQGNGFSCKDVDECKTDVHDCSPHASCTNAIGGHNCSCLPGFQGDGRTCQDVDECIALIHNCSEHASCINTIGGYECKCRAGFKGNGFDCIDENECEMQTHNCSVYASCTNSIGAFRCKCFDGYEGNGWECTDIDECGIGTDNCHSSASCVNKPGSYSCFCKRGYTGNGRYCTDINECQHMKTKCSPNARCINNQGSYSCKCLDGYQGDGETCYDEDECSRNPCNPNAVCRNTDGSYTCSCKTGFGGDGKWCNDYNECLAGVSDCHKKAVCVNTWGSYHCSCSKGYHGNGHVCKGKCKLSLNQQHGIYDNGKALPQVYRERVLDLYHQGSTQRQISQDMRVSIGYVNKVVQFYEQSNSSLPAPRKTPVGNIFTADVVEYVESEKLSKPSVYATEIQQRLLFDGISPPGQLPSESGIKKCIREDCKMTKKKISPVPTESLSQENSEYTDYFLDHVAQRDYWKVHFFDESSVIVTAGNRVYGNSYLGEPAIEFQRYASNANYTLNLLHSIHGVDYFDVLRGPSNSMELLNFFNEALSVNRADGTTILENGDMVIMDNCGFHHGHFAEPLLRDILQEHGVDLLFQPAYSPHLNTCELCFHQIKCYLRQNSSLTANETEIAIGEGVSKITAANSVAYFRKCGYI